MFIICTMIVLSLLTGVVSADTARYGNWTEITDNASILRYLPGITVFGDTLWVIGGRGEFYQNDVWSSPDGKTWELVTDNASFSPRVSPKVVSYNNSLWVIGGGDSNTNWNDVWSSPDGKTWNLVTDNATFSPRFGGAVGVFKNRLWLIGGNNNDVWSSADGKNWELVTNNANFSPRYGHSVVTFNDRLWVIGGNWNNDTWSSPDGKTWTLINGSAPFRKMEYTPAIAFDDKLWIVGGGSFPSTHQTKYPPATDFNEVWSSSDGNLWTLETEHAGFSPRFLHGLVVFHDGIWVIGGSGGNGQDVWEMPLLQNSSSDETNASPTQARSTPVPIALAFLAIGITFVVLGLFRKT